jgi:1,4-dihydroxy-2-naphthoate octaprenyltransferase
MKNKMKLQNAPPLAIWLIMLAISYLLLYINQFIRDLTTVFWMGLIGCAIGTFLTYIAENWYGKKKEDTDGRA